MIMMLFLGKRAGARASIASTLVSVLLTFTGCGAAITGTNDAGLNTVVQTLARVVVGQVTGDVTSISSIMAMDNSTGTTFTSLLFSPKNKAGRMAAGPATFSMELPTGKSYSLRLLKADGTSAALLQYSKNAAGTLKTGSFNVNADSAGASMDLGNVTVPAGTGTATALVYIEPEKNPLSQNDLDGDGASDFDDDDDDNDLVPDDLDNDDNNDGLLDADEELNAEAGQIVAGGGEDDEEESDSSGDGSSPASV